MGKAAESPTGSFQVERSYCCCLETGLPARNMSGELPSALSASDRTRAARCADLARRPGVMDQFTIPYWQYGRKCHHPVMAWLNRKFKVSQSSRM
jgi:hypothetical protein